MTDDKILIKLYACKEARHWVATQKNYEEAWQNCERGDWMLWLARRLKVDNRKLALAKFKCANQVRHLMGDQRSITALDAAEKYGNGEISRDELNTYVAPAYSAASAAYSAASAAAAAAYSAAYDADADAAAYAADADAAAAQKKSLKKSADFCREILTEEVLIAYAKLK